MDSERRARDAGVRRGRAETPHVEVVAPFLERRGGEEHVHQPPRVLFELASFARRVAVAEEQQVDLVRGIAGALQRDQLTGGSRARIVDRRVARIDEQRPRVAERVAVRIALLEHHDHRRRGSRKPEGLGEGARDRFRLGRRLPFAEDRREPARVEDAPRAGVAHLEQVFARVGIVDRMVRVPGPRQRLENEPVEGEALLGSGTYVDVVDTERARRAGREQRQEGEQHCGRLSWGAVPGKRVASAHDVRPCE